MYYLDCKNAALLRAMHGYVVLTNKKDETGNSKTTKFTRKDSQESFIFVAPYKQQVEDHLDHLRK